MAYYEANRDAYLIRFKTYWLDNHEANLAAGKLWRENNKEHKAANDRAWQAANPEKVRKYRVASEAKRRAAGGSLTSAQVDGIAARQKFKCAICKTSVKKRRHVDHIKPISKGGLTVPSNIQILCPRCNMRKHAKDPIEHMQDLGFLL